MQPDKIITLKNQKKYLLLLESEIEKDGYFLAVLLDENDKPTKCYAILQEVIKDGKTFIRTVKNPVILNGLLEDFRSQYDDLLKEITTA